MTLAKLPAKVDLRSKMPKPILDQGQLGSCTANAIATAHEFCQKKQHLKGVFIPSRLFIYYNERAMEGTTGSDSGAMIRDGIKSINKQGVCPEKMWPYVIGQFATKPPTPCYTEATKHKAISYHRIARSLAQMKGCLAEGFPWVYGFSVYDSFESHAVANTGVVPMPDLGKESLLGGHAVLAVGYDDTQQRFITRNSWGKDWGDAGYFTMPYAYLLDSNLSDDFWTVRLIQ
jgi:C1A family cysteine protease